MSTSQMASYHGISRHHDGTYVNRVVGEGPGPWIKLSIELSRDGAAAVPAACWPMNANDSLGNPLLFCRAATMKWGRETTYHPYFAPTGFFMQAHLPPDQPGSLTLPKGVTPLTVSLAGTQLIRPTTETQIGKLFTKLMSSASVDHKDSSATATATVRLEDPPFLNVNPMSLAPVPTQQVSDHYTGPQPTFNNYPAHDTAQNTGLNSPPGAPEPSGLPFDWRQTARYPDADSLPGAPGLTGRAYDWIDLPFDPSIPGAQVHFVSNQFGDPNQGLDYQTFTPQATVQPHQPWSNHVPSAPRGDGQSQSAQSYHPPGASVQGPGYGSRESGPEQASWDNVGHPGYGSQQHGGHWLG